MKVLIIDDEWNLFVVRVVEALTAAKIDVTGCMETSETTGRIINASGEQRCVSLDVLALAREADVIFLDHNMCCMNGEELLRSWEIDGVDLAGKRIIGISSDSQPYLEERLGDPSMLFDAEWVKNFLGIK